MRINHNISSMSTQASIFKTNRALGKSLEKLSTGLRINSASDDAAGLAISENLRTQVRGAAQAQRNALDGISALNIAEGAANEVSDILQRMRELSVQSANDTLTSSERAYTNQEFEELSTEIERIAQVTNFNGQELLSDATANRFGATGSDVLWVDANGTVGEDSITVSINSLTETDIGVDTLQIDTQTGAQAAITAIDDAIGSVNTERATMGATINRLEHAVNNLMVSQTNQQAAESQIRDVDFAKESSNFTKNQILTQSATAMLAQSNMIPSSVLSLLG